jgi:hypothetical protein
VELVDKDGIQKEFGRYLAVFLIEQFNFKITNTRENFFP